MVAASALHVAWGVGSSWPYRDRRSLAEGVAGTARMPPPAACFTIGGGLAAAAAVVAGVGGRRPSAQLARSAVAAAFLIKGVAGVTGTTRYLVPWTPSEQFRQLDRRRYGPLCLGIGGAVVASMLGASTGTVQPAIGWRRRKSAMAAAIGAGWVIAKE